jgi:hypothetical protein
MKLKKYIEFIKESIDDLIDSGKIWKLSEDDIMDYFVDFTDEGWFIRIDFGFVVEKRNWNYKQEWEEEIFSELLLPGKSLEPAYFIMIRNISSTTNVDITDSLIFAHDIIKDATKAREVKVLDAGGELDINNLIIKGGIFIGKDLKEEEQIEAEEYVSFFIKTGDSIEISQKDAADNYGWSYDRVDESGNIYTHVDLEEMSDIMLSRNSKYKEFLVKGMEIMWDYYESGNYIPDTDSFFKYSLNKENRVLMVKAIIKEIGGWSVLKDDDILNSTDEEFKTEDEFIEYVLKERFYDTLKNMCRDSEICGEVKDIVANWEMDAHVDTNHDEIMAEFDDIVSKEFSYQKIKKEVIKKYKSKDSDGKEKINEYKDEVLFYEIPFDNKWILEYGDYEPGDLSRFGNIVDIFKEYCGEAYFQYEMKPRISDWGNVDQKALNSEIKAILNNYLNRD